jgi:hypothetical protein
MVPGGNPVNFPKVASFLEKKGIFIQGEAGLESSCGIVRILAQIWIYPG